MNYFLASYLTLVVLGISLTGWAMWVEIFCSQLRQDIKKLCPDHSWATITAQEQSKFPEDLALLIVSIIPFLNVFAVIVSIHEVWDRAGEFKYLKRNRAQAQHLANLLKSTPLFLNTVPQSFHAGPERLFEDPTSATLEAFMAERASRNLTF